MHTSASVHSIRDNIGSALNAAEQSGNKQPVLQRGNLHSFVDSYHQSDHYWEKSFPALYPYGRGGPSDILASGKTFSVYAKHRLMQGGLMFAQGRRYQWNASWIFMAYHTETRRKIAGITGAAAREKTDLRATGLADDQETENMNSEILPDNDEMMEFLVNQNVHCGNSSVNADSYLADGSSSGSSSSGDDDEKDFNVARMRNLAAFLKHAEADPHAPEEIKRLMERMVPYCKDLAGTPLQIAYERKKLLAMISSPLITNDSSWRWFLTMSPADTYEPLLFQIAYLGYYDKYENLSDELIDQEPQTAEEKEWLEVTREKEIKRLTKIERLDILRRHPALSARIFEIKQEAIHHCIINGVNAPLGIVSHFWRRIEVNCFIIIFVCTVC